MTESPVGQRLKFLISQLGLDTRTFSQALNVSETTTRNYFNRGSKPSADYLEKLTNSFGEVNLSWLLTGKGDPILPGYPLSSNLQQANIENNSGVGISHGGTNNITNLRIHDCQRELESAHKELAALRRELDLQAALLASKEEMLTLLRGGHNRPN